MATTGTQWKPITEHEPADGETVLTCIDDAKGRRNEQRLYRSRRPGCNPLWWTADGEIYVYYQPTHFLPNKGCEDGPRN